MVVQRETPLPPHRGHLITPAPRQVGHGSAKQKTSGQTRAKQTTNGQSDAMRILMVMFSSVRCLLSQIIEWVMDWTMLCKQTTVQ